MLEENSKKLTFEQLDTVVGGVGKTETKLENKPWPKGLKSKVINGVVFSTWVASFTTIFLLGNLETNKNRHDQQGN